MVFEFQISPTFLKTGMSHFKSRPNIKDNISVNSLSDFLSNARWERTQKSREAGEAEGLNKTYLQKHLQGHTRQTKSITKKA